MNKYTGNFTELTKKALRNAGYEEDATELVAASIMQASNEAPATLVMLAHFDEVTGRVYLTLDDKGSWTAEY